MVAAGAVANGSNSDDSPDKPRPFAERNIPGSSGIFPCNFAPSAPSGWRRCRVDGGEMTATSAVLCSRCMTPCALEGDEIPEDGLCAFCRGAETPGAPRASLLWLHRPTQWPPAGLPRELASERKAMDDYDTDPTEWTDD